jgi:hypothetical protein
MPIQKNSFEGGINSDLAQRLLPQNEVLNLMNGRVGVTEYGRNGRVENFPGTTQISQSVFPPYGTSQTISAIPDSSRNRIIFSNYNSFGYHGIYCLDYSSPSSPVVYAVLYDTQVTGGLNFSKSFRIDRNAKIVGDMYYWTDNNEEVRRINLEAAIKANQSGYATTVTPYSFPVSQSVISLLRRPFGLPVIPAKGTDGTFTENYLELFSGQFASRFIYRDGEKSVMSTPSEFVNYNYTTDTFNRIVVRFPLTETFDQDVQIIQLAVRFGNDPNYFVIREWNKANAADLAEINAHNANITELTYNFYNDETSIAIGNADSVKPFDSIPITAKTIETANNRLFLANYVKGYDTPSVTSLSGAATTEAGDPVATPTFKSNSSYQIGIRFRDNGKRQSFVVTNTNCLVNFPDRSYGTVPYTSLTWTLSNLAPTLEIPEWAIYYDILITKNLRTRFFIQSLATNFQYAKKDQDGVITYQSTYDSTVYAIAIDTSVLTNSGSGYIYNEGDLCRIYLSNTATVYEQQVLGQDGNYVLLKPKDIGSFSPMPGAYYEIYTPYKPSDNETYYTIGQSYLVLNPGTGSRSYSILSGSISGDITRFRTTIFIIIGVLDFRTEAMSPNYKRWQDWFKIYGETNIQSLLGQENKTNFIQWSNVIIQNSNTNGLSTFDALDEKSLPQSMGEINKIQTANKVTEEGNVMLAIGERETASLYLGEVQLVGASANAFIASSPGVIGTVNVLRGSYGTINPESVVEYLGLVFWIDVLNGVFVQYSAAGLEPVSRYNHSRFFKRYCKDYLAASMGNLDNINGFHHIPTGIDPFHKEAFVTLPGLIYENYAATLPSYSSVPSYATSIINRFDVYDQLGKRVCFSYDENKWGSNFEGLAEMYAYLQNTLFSFKNGVPYTHHTNTTNWNTVYGVQYPVRVCFTGNVIPSALKILNNIALESNVIPDFTVALTALPNIQITDLSASDYINQESNMYADFFMDRLDPNGSGTADEKLYNGNSLTDFAIFVMTEFQQYSGLAWMQFANIGFSTSRGQKQILNPINT